MKKQIIYPKLIPRVFSTTLDLTLLAIITLPILPFCFFGLMSFFFRDYFIQYNVELYNSTQMMISIARPEFYEYIKAGNFSRYSFFILSNLMVNFTLIGSYFVGFWYYKGATLSKMFMHMKIVDAVTFAKPTLWQLIRRFLGYITFPFGIWFILFSSQGRALHDRIAGTVVIKS